MTFYSSYFHLNFGVCKNPSLEIGKSISLVEMVLALSSDTEIHFLCFAFSYRDIDIKRDRVVIPCPLTFDSQDLLAVDFIINNVSIKSSVIFSYLINICSVPEILFFEANIKLFIIITR